MRISGGDARGVRLRLPKGARPTTEHVRRAIFSSLAQWLPSARVLDLYCGSGALGLEALSRGADAAVFVDSDPQAVSVARANAKAAGLEGSSAFRKRDATRYVAGGAGRDGPFDLVFMDPPYSKRLDPALRRSLAEIVADRGRVVLEQRKGLDPPEAPQGFIVEADRQYGDTRVLVFRRTEAS